MHAVCQDSNVDIKELNHKYQIGGVVDREF